MELNEGDLAEAELYEEDDISEDKDIYTEEGLEEEEDRDGITSAEQGFMFGYLAA